MAAGTNPYTKYRDEELMKLITERDKGAFGELYDRYSRLLFNYFLRMLWKDKELARDFTQELFMKLIHKPHLYDSSRPFKTWVYSVAHNMCKNEYAKHEVRKAAAEELKATESTAHESSAQKSIDRKVFREKLKKALEEMDEVKRTTFELRFYQELNISEISEIMQCSEGTVKSRLFYMLKELNKKLKVFEGIAVWMMLIGSVFL